MTITIRLPALLGQELTEYCAKHRLSKSEAVKLALEELLRAAEAHALDTRYSFIGADKGDGSDISGNIKAALRARFRGLARTRSTLRKAAYSGGDLS